MVKILTNANGQAYISNNKVILAPEGSAPAPSGTGKYLVQVIDYDGTVLKSDHLDEGDSFTLPQAPSHTKLVFEEWSSPVEITNNTITVPNSDLTIGAVYHTVSGLSEFDITLTAVTGLRVFFDMEGTKDWGDGTTDTSTLHTYASAGDYTITCDGTSVPENVFSDMYILTNVRLGENVTSIDYEAFSSCYSLKSITIPSGVTSIDGEAFNNCYSLKSITIPSGVTSIDYGAFSNCYSLKSITIPSGVTSISGKAFNNCYSLKSITITSVDGGAFNNCYSLKSITIPSGVTSISSETFNICCSILEYDFSKHTAVPKLSNTTAFSNINHICKIKVPLALEAEWKAAANWSTYANYIVGV